MINPIELTTGNYLYTPNGNIITTTHNTIKALVKDKVNYRPIPLNEKWLKKFGFIECDLFGEFQGEEPVRNYIPEKSEMFDFVVSVYEDNTIYLTSHGLTWGVELIHVHQFQNVFYCLTGQPLIKFR